MLINYLKTAVKVLLRRKVFTAISLFGISFTLVVLMVGAALFDHSFGPHAPETKSERILGVHHMSLRGEREGGRPMHRMGPPAYGLLDRTVRSLPGAEKVSIFTVFDPVVAYVKEERVNLYLKRTDGAFFSIYDFKFLEGGPYGEDDEANGRFVAVINASTKRKLVGDGPAVGKTIEVDGQRFRVAGVVEDVPMLRLVPFADVWVPLSTARSSAFRTELIDGNYMAAILLKSPRDIPELKAAFQARLKAFQFPTSDFKTAEGGADTLLEATARTLFDNDERAAGKLLLVLFLAMVLFMVLPTLNLVNLNVSRILERASEIGVRKAFGASSRALVAQFIVENVVLCLVGGALALALSFGVLEILSASGALKYARFAPNLRIFAYGLGITLFFGLFSGVYPALKMSRLDPVEALRGRHL